MSKLLSNGVYSIINRFTGLAVSLVTGIIIARYLGAEGKGLLYLITQTVSLTSVIFAFGFGPSILFHLKKDKISKDFAFLISLIYLLVFTIIFILIYLFFKTTIINLLNNSLSEFYLY